MGDLFEDKTAVVGSFDERLTAVHSQIKAESTTEVTDPPRDKGGRRPGSKVVIGPDGKRRVVKPERVKAIDEGTADPEVTESDILSPTNFENLLGSMLPGLDKETLRNGAMLHAATSQRKLPGFVKDWADVIMLAGWWAKVAFDMIKAKNGQAQEVDQEQDPGKAQGSESSQRVDTPGKTRKHHNFF